MAVAHGIHTDIQTKHHSVSVTERCRKVWWTVYVLDCHLSSLMGVPLAMAEQDISAQLPTFAGSSQKSLALSIHVSVAKTTTLILRSKWYAISWLMEFILIVPITSCLWGRRSYG